ncbi:MAG: GumC family protein [Phycisphaerales bacterium]
MTHESVEWTGIESASDAGTESIARVAHRAFRGRYRAAMILGAVAAAIGGATGYLLVQPVYTAEGLVRVAPTTPKILYENDENQLPPMYDTLVETEATYIESRRVLERASTDDRLRDAGWETGADGVAELSRRVTVGRRPRNQLILVHGVHEDPILAQRAVNAVLLSYQELYADQQSLQVANREQNLERRQEDLQRKLEGRRDSVRALSERFGTSDLSALHDAKLRQLLRVNEQVDEYSVALAAHDQTDGAESPDNAPAFISNPTLEQEYLAAQDGELSMLVAERRKIDAEWEDAESRYGSSHRVMTDLQKRRQTLQRQIEERAVVVRELLERTPLANETIEGYRLTAEEIEARRERLVALRDQLSTELTAISTTMQEIAAHEEQAAYHADLLAETTRELEKLRVERPFIDAGRITITEAALPLEPSTDRRFQLAALGAVAGLGAPFVLLWLFSVIRPTLRYLDDLDHARFNAPVLGTLPDLRKAEGDAVELATLSVHHIRNMLRLTRPAEDGYGAVYAITSATPRDGKTSLLIALGASFAAERLRTVIVDADLVGRGLTSAFQLAGERGFTEATEAGDAADGIHATDVQYLSILPAGDPTFRRPEELSIHDLRTLVESLRAAFDVVLIDTGPLTGSLEANLVAALADQTVLAVARGQDPRLVNGALERLDRLGAACAGIVFNRASSSDVRSGSSQFSFRSQSMRSGENGTSNGRKNGATDREPTILVRAMLDRGQPVNN